MDFKEIPVGSRQEAAHKCDNSTLLEVCSICCSPVCRECVDWECMRKANTWQIVCKKCSKLFDNCKGDN
jgi:hypothetical protein